MKNTVLLLMLLLLQPLHAQEKRLALVIGIQDYDYVKLDYPVNNANDMAKSLSDLGFDVMLLNNLSQAEMKFAIDTFGEKLSSYDAGLFYYSGLAVMAHGNNYLVPAKTEPNTENEVEYNCVNLQRVNRSMEDAGTTTNLLILDASADNIFERQWTGSVKGHGLTFMDAPEGTLIAYSTSPGRITAGSGQRNSIYTAAILKNIQTPNQSIEDMFKTVRKEVRNATGNKQIPWESTSLKKEFCFDVDPTAGKPTPKTSDKIILASNSSSREVIPEFVDPRDGQSYTWVRIGEQVWMAENLNFEITDDSWCYENQERNCKSFGRLYNYKAALAACPEGWHLPSDEEWKMLEMTIGMSRTEADKRGFNRGTIQGGRLKSTGDLWEPPNNGATNDVGFNALPGGWRDASGVFDSQYKWGFYWSSTVQTNRCAWSRILLYDQAIIERFNTMQDWGHSVRCIKDDPEIR